MITWIQKYFQHHFRVVFAVLLALIIVAFVFTIGAQGSGRADRQAVERPFFGYNLSLQSDQQKFASEAQLSIRLRAGMMALFQISEGQMEAYAQHRAASVYLADQWHIPAPTSDELKKHIETLREFTGQDGKFDSAAYTRFRDSLKTNPRSAGLTEADVLRVISDDIRSEKVQKLLAGPGYVLPFEVKNELTEEDTTWTVATATADYAAFKPEIKPTDEQLTAFFDQSGGRYDIPPKVVVSVIEFPALPLVPSVTVTDAEIRAYYDQNPARFPKPADPAKPATPAAPTVTATPPADPAADFAAVRAQVESALKLERAQKLAAKQAADVTLALHRAGAKTPEAIDRFLAGKNLATKTLPPFSREAAPLELSGNPAVAAEAFRLGKDRLTSDALATPTGAVILYWKESQETRKPLFLAVRDTVLADYSENERRKRFTDTGRAVKEQLEARLKAGDTLEKAAAAVESAGLKLEAKIFEPFSRRTRSAGVDQTLVNSLGRLEKGQLSDMRFTGDKGIFIHVLDKKAPDTSEANPMFVNTRAEFATASSRTSGGAALNEIVERELKRSEPKVQ
ncbi:MAG: peptidyl-prolyl cis-trans isomerase [Opitutaceae bacterium]|nr:peptidyl-prolyl cis-trans isomerase [Opitutaceae bacterium]